MAPIALLGVQEGRFAWGLLGLVLFALVLVAVAVILAVVALRRSRRALSAVSAIVSGGFQPELTAEAIAREPAAEPPTRILPSEPELAPAGEELEAPEADEPETERADFSAAEPGAGEAAAPTFEAPPSSPRGGPAEGILCECGHAKGDHHRLTASKWMCLADVVPACQCRQFVPQRNETASLVRS
ncbi:MAG: hypothetical protein M3Q23_12085, partial [Actinomycetota bacterium]|nr:hypothetical protein [Actinomycetota bacterium]